MNVRFHRLAQQELHDAITYYEEQAPGLGDDFLSAVIDACDLLSRHPKAAPLVAGDARRLVMRRFPYNLIYSLIGGEPRILAVAHQSRIPAYWLGRSAHEIE